MKKIISSLGVIVFVGAMAFAGTGAFFSDTETSTGNVFTAGAIDLKVDSVAHVNGLVCFVDTEEETSVWLPESVVIWVPAGEGELAGHLETVGDTGAAVTAYNLANPSNIPQAGDACHTTWELKDLDGQQEVSTAFFDYGDLKPGDEGENTISLHVFDNDAYMCATVNNVADLDNSQTEPEGDAETDIDPMSEGELDEELELVIWVDDGDNVLEEAEVADILVETDNANGIEGVYDLFTPGNANVLPASTTAYLGVYWCYGDVSRVGSVLSCDGSAVGNVSQTDSLEADISFYVEQARHNENFTCRREEEPVVTRLTLAKTVTPAEVVPDSAFTLTATGPSVISGIEGAGAVTMATVLPGAYVLTESEAGPGGEILTWSCTGNATPEVGNTVTILAGETVTCEATNVYNAQ